MTAAASGTALSVALTADARSARVRELVAAALEVLGPVGGAEVRCARAALEMALVAIDRKAKGGDHAGR